MTLLVDCKQLSFDSMAQSQGIYNDKRLVVYSRQLFRAGLHLWGQKRFLHTMTSPPSIAVLWGLRKRLRNILHPPKNT